MKTRYIIIDIVTGRPMGRMRADGPLVPVANPFRYEYETREQADLARRNNTHHTIVEEVK